MKRARAGGVGSPGFTPNSEKYVYAPQRDRMIAAPFTSPLNEQ